MSIGNPVQRAFNSLKAYILQKRIKPLSWPQQNFHLNHNYTLELADIVIVEKLCTKKIPKPEAKVFQLLH